MEAVLDANVLGNPSPSSRGKLQVAISTTRDEEWAHKVDAVVNGTSLSWGEEMKGESVMTHKRLSMRRQTLRWRRHSSLC